MHTFPDLKTSMNTTTRLHLTITDFSHKNYFKIHFFTSCKSFFHTFTSKPSSRSFLILYSCVQIFSSSYICRNNCICLFFQSIDASTAVIPVNISPALCSNGPFLSISNPWCNINTSATRQYVYTTIMRSRFVGSNKNFFDQEMSVVFSIQC